MVFPLAIETVPKILEDMMFQSLKKMDTTTPPLTRALTPEWMSDMSLRIIDAISDHRCQPDHNRNVARNLIKSVRKSLSVDTRHRVKVAEEEIRACLETSKGTPTNLQEDYSILK